MATPQIPLIITGTRHLYYEKKAVFLLNLFSHSLHDKETTLETLVVGLSATWEARHVVPLSLIGIRKWLKSTFATN